MIEEARAGQLTHGSIGCFLRDPSASFDLIALYVAERISYDLDARLVLADSAPLDPARTVYGAHLTDGESVVVSINLQARVTYEDCVTFLSSATAARSARGLLNGDPVPSLHRVIIARNARSTLCPVMALTMGTYAIDAPIIDTTVLEYWMSMLIGAHPIAAIGAAPPAARPPRQLTEEDEEHRVEVTIDTTDLGFWLTVLIDAHPIAASPDVDGRECVVVAEAQSVPVLVCAACGASDVRTKRCGICRVVRYCSIECQQAQWSMHRRDCASLRAS